MSEERLNVFQRVAAVSKEIGTIQKNGTNSFHGYDYATESDFVNGVKPLFDKYGLIMFLVTQEILGVVPMMKGKDEYTGKFITTIRSTYRIVATDDANDYITVQTGGQGVDSGDKGVYKAITGAKKYAIANAFLIATGDDPEKDQLSGSRKVSSMKSSGNLEF